MAIVGAVAEMLRKRDRRDEPRASPSLSQFLLSVPVLVAVLLPPVLALPNTGTLAALGWAAYGCLAGGLVVVADRRFHGGIPRGPKETAHVRSPVLRFFLFVLCTMVFMRMADILIRTGSWGADFLLRCAICTLGGVALLLATGPRPQRY